MDRDYLWQKLSPAIQQALLDPDVFEIALNPDSSLWVSSRTRGSQKITELNEADVSVLVNALSQSNFEYLNHAKPFLDCTLPFGRERVCITVPPITEGVSFNIRKHSALVFTLADYVAQGVLTERQACLLKHGISERKNILVSGGPGSGKTTLTNALLDAMAEVVPDGHRVLILEQVPELRCRVPNHKRLLTTDTIDLRTLLWIAMRNSPDRIVVGFDCASQIDSRGSTILRRSQTCRHAGTGHYQSHRNSKWLSKPDSRDRITRTLIAIFQWTVSQAVR